MEDRPSGRWWLIDMWGTAESLCVEYRGIAEETLSVQGGRDQPLGREESGRETERWNYWKGFELSMKMETVEKGRVPKYVNREPGKPCLARLTLLSLDALQYGSFDLLGTFPYTRSPNNTEHHHNTPHKPPVPTARTSGSPVGRPID